MSDIEAKYSGRIVMRVKVRSKTKIRRVKDGKEKVVLYPGTLTDAFVLKGDSIVVTVDKYGNELKMKKSEVKIEFRY